MEDWEARGGAWLLMTARVPLALQEACASCTRCVCGATCKADVSACTMNMVKIVRP